jgi:hypothetical protein
MSVFKCGQGQDTSNTIEKTEDVFDAKLSQVVNETPYTLASNTTAGGYTISLNDATGLIAGDEIGLFQDSNAPSSYFGTILDVTNDVLTMDMPLNIAFDTTLSPTLFEINSNANVDGSSTPVNFVLTNDSNISVDVARVLIHITDEASQALTDGQFGALAELTRGIVLRKLNADGTYINYWGGPIKNNGGFGLVAYDKEYDPAPPSGQKGIRVRFTFTKHGSFARLTNGEQLQLVVQDDLTGLVLFNIMAEGHLTKPYGL